MPDRDVAATDREVSPWIERFDAELAPGLRVLELGCGLGHDATELVARGLRVTALDRSRERVAQARRRAPGAAFLVADMTDPLPFRDGTFDLVVASLSLHYFSWAVTCRIIGEIGRVARDGGCLLCRVNAVGDVLHGYGQGAELEPDFYEVSPGHTKRFFTPEALVDALGPAFRVRRLAPRVSWTEEGDKPTLECLADRAGG